ncbi:SDR family NAD(P)-dependent oxidoreductase [Rhodococcus tibetensis]|uniref:SDR family NAD(P)-dependent oxidoreductase n=1 Tax=Rhodococcus tibetensis TaxID=2965064 RepID=A0ABT1QF80_9NOCA|nr:SDR family NAD(P)-dependent oxidoreductase [Rhodococcus sp. FXJ9.536]MCQ4120862.1 SDR family NAD(P)-dependent oxidoreductase [Rhodococcus sp. FXJ9.536]
MQIPGAVAVVTGAGAGLGLATAHLLSQRGARVAALDLTAPPGEATDTWLPLTADVGSATEVDAAFDAAVSAFGRVDIVVHCAGIAGGFRLIGRDGPVDPGRFTRVIDVNLVGTFHVLRAAAWRMSRDQRPDGENGVIVTTASIAAYEGQQGQLAYSASKAGVIGMLLPAARELAQYGIRCTAIAPGAFETALTTDLPAELQEQLTASVAYPQRLGRPTEFADLACAVITNEMLNGEVIRLDAGARLSPR